MDGVDPARSLEAAVNPADCGTGQRVLYQGRIYTVSALAGEHATIADGIEFRSVPIADLEPVLTVGCADAEPDPVWSRLALFTAALAVGTAVGLTAWWLAS